MKNLKVRGSLDLNLHLLRWHIGKGEQPTQGKNPMSMSGIPPRGDLWSFPNPILSETHLRGKSVSFQRYPISPQKKVYVFPQKKQVLQKKDWRNDIIWWVSIRVISFETSFKFNNWAHGRNRASWGLDWLSSSISCAITWCGAWMLQLLLFTYYSSHIPSRNPFLWVLLRYEIWWNNDLGKGWVCTCSVYPKDSPAFLHRLLKGRHACEWTWQSMRNTRLDL